MTEFTDEDFAGLHLVADRGLLKDAENYGNLPEINPGAWLYQNVAEPIGGEGAKNSVIGNTVGSMVPYFIPGVGEALAAYDAVRNYSDMVSDFKRGKIWSGLGNLGSGALNTVFAIPGIAEIGNIGKGIYRGAKAGIQGARAARAARAGVNAGRSIAGTAKAGLKGAYTGAKSAIQGSAARGLARTGAQFDHAAQSAVDTATLKLTNARQALQNGVASGVDATQLAKLRGDVSAAQTELGNLTRRGVPIAADLPIVRNLLPQSLQKGSLRGELMANQKMVNAGVPGVPGAVTGVPTFGQTFGRGGTWRTAVETSHKLNPVDPGLAGFLGGGLAFSAAQSFGDAKYRNGIYEDIGKANDQIFGPTSNPPDSGYYEDNGQYFYDPLYPGD